MKPMMNTFSKVQTEGVILRMVGTRAKCLLGSLAPFPHSN